MNLRRQSSDCFPSYCSLQSHTLTNQTTRYSQFNALHVSGRIYHAEIVPNNGKPFLAVSVISTATRDGVDIVYRFNDSQGLMALHEKGYFGKGRQVTITGHISNVSEIYTDKKTGEVRTRKNPEISLVGVSVLDGGLGPMPTATTGTQRPAAGTVVTRVGTPAQEVSPELDTVPVF